MKIEIEKNYLIRLKDYIKKVRETAENDLSNKMAVISLLGYLEVLELLVEDNKNAK